MRAEINAGANIAPVRRRVGIVKYMAAAAK